MQVGIKGPVSFPLVNNSHVVSCGKTLEKRGAQAGAEIIVQFHQDIASPEIRRGAWIKELHFRPFTV